MMRYIILGSNGFIGRGLVKFFQKKINFVKFKKYPNINPNYLKIMMLLLIAWENLLIIETILI